MKKREIVGTLCLAVAILGAPLGVRAVDAASADHSFQMLSDAALAAVDGGKTCACVDHNCTPTVTPVGCTYDAGAINSCYGCTSPFVTNTGIYDNCERTAGSGCCDDEDCTPRCVKVCTTRSWTTTKVCSNSTPHCAVQNPCNYR